MTCKYQALTAATVDPNADANPIVNRVNGRNNMVGLDLYQAVTLMTETQKRIVNDLLRRDAKIQLVQVAMGQGREKQGTLSFNVSRFTIHDTAHISITPRGRVTGTVFDNPFKCREDDDDHTYDHISCLAELVARYNDMGLYL